MSEARKWLGQYQQYIFGSGLNLGSGGDPVVPWAIQVELPEPEFSTYTKGHTLGPIEQVELRGDATSLYWFTDDCLDWVLSSHLLEDYPAAEWPAILREWIRVIRPGGHLVVLVPDKERWNLAIQNGQPPNCEHRHEPSVGELTQVVRALAPYMNVLLDRFVDDHDYTILFVAQKLQTQAVARLIAGKKEMW